MKAIEYYEKYHSRFFKPKTIHYMDKTGNTPMMNSFQTVEPEAREAISSALADLILEFSKEVETICKMRNCRYDDGVQAVLKEQNQKWNALSNLFEKNLGVSPLKRDGFTHFWSKCLEDNNGTAQKKS